MRRILTTITTLSLITAAVIGSAGIGDAAEMDPLLRLLIAKGVITEAEAASLQTEAETLEREPAPPEAPKAPDTPTTSSWTDRFDIGGDVRLRYEGFSKDGSYDDGRRDRFRIRFRTGFEATVTDWMKVGLELRTGSSDDPVSNNTTFDNAFSVQDINLAEGYLSIRPTDGFGLIAGKFDPKHWWTVSDFQWDDDVTVEGLLTNVDLASGNGRFKGLDLVTYAFVLEEQKSASDAHLLGLQLRSNFRLNDTNSLKLGAGFDLWDHPQNVVDLTAGGSLGGNSVTNLVDENGRLLSDFDILNVFAEYKNTRNKQWPIKLSLFFYNNLGAEGLGAANDTGYFGRFQFGDYKKPWQVALRYSYYYSEPDALFYAFTQSDTSRGSDAEAHRFDLRIGAVKKSYFNLTWYNTKPVLEDDETLDRWQMDYIVKF